MVGRFVQEQHVRAPEQQPGERNPHLPTARKLVGGSVSIGGQEAEPVEHAADFGLDPVAAAAFELFLQLGVLVYERVEVTVSLRVDLAFDGPHRLLDAQQVGDRAQHFVVERAARLDAGILGQVPDDRNRRQDDPPAVGLLEPGDDLEQRRLAGAVGRDQRRAFARFQRQRRAVKHALAAVVLFQIFDS